MEEQEDGLQGRRCQKGDFHFTLARRARSLMRGTPSTASLRSLNNPPTHIPQSSC